MSAKAKIGVLGASGYTGAELVRLLLRHPQVEIALLTADRRAGKPMADVFPQFAPYPLPMLSAIEITPGIPGKLRPIRMTALDRTYTDKQGRVWAAAQRDLDTVLVKVKRQGDGNVCHTGERTCFFRKLDGQ